MKKVYLDNASTTAIHPEVIQEMMQVMSENNGNPSSTHSFGRTARVTLETSRKTIASLLNAEAREIIFTSGGTEANNWVIRTAVKDLGVKRIISSKSEHHSVLHTVELVAREYDIPVSYVKLFPDGAADINDLNALLKDGEPALVSLMHVNNETGAILDLEAVGRLCHENNSFFHTDTVQSIGKELFDLQNLTVDFLTASAHKFHGPKGIGFAFIRKNSPVRAMLYGGEQEKNLRAGTEAVHQIAGMAKALQLSYDNLDQNRKHISELKEYFHQQLRQAFHGFKINGTGGEELFYNITNVLLPLPEDKTAMILFHLDMKGIAVSRGSACQSGSIRPSHVLREILPAEDIGKPSLRVSFSHYNTKEDIDIFIEALKSV